jgi:hypothetical protein
MKNATQRLAVPGAAVLVTVAVLAPLAAPGYVLSYDMVFTPRQPLRWDLIVPSDALPRAVPLDALVSLVTQVLPGWLLQRVVLAAILLLAAAGAARLLRTERTLVRLVAAVGYAWTPFLAERLLLGQWGLLLAYAALPWLIDACASPRKIAVLGWSALCAVTPTGGILAFVIVAALAPRRCWIAAALNLPWLVAAALTSADGRSDPDGVAAFAARGADWSGPLGALLGTGGIWNAQTTLPSRSSVLAPIGTIVLLALAVAGWRALRLPGKNRLLAVAAGGFALALAGVVPGVNDGLAWLVAHVPGAGLLRDGQKFLIPYALLLCLSAAAGAGRAGRPVLIGALLLPIAVQPDLAWGGAGRLRPVAYPADWPVVAGIIERDPGDVLSLPLAAYRTYSWNHGRTVLDPLPRYVDADVRTDDRLLVGDLVVDGESRRDPARPVRWVVVQRVIGGPPVTVPGGRLVFGGIDLQLYRIDTVEVSY